ncbi:MAG: LacI family DNA-binding transcriptional regulator [Proteocatella sp.]
MVVTIKQIAEMAGVSKATVSLALNNKGAVGEKTKQRIWDIANEYGYNKKNFSVKKNLLFIKYIGNGAAIEHNGDFVARIVDAIEFASRDLGYNLTIKNIEVGEFEKEIKCIDFENFKGVILLATELEVAKGDLINTIPIPVVAVDNMFDDYDVDSVVMDNYGGIFTAVKYLYDLGHRHIGYIDSLIRFQNFDQRTEGYERALKKLGLAYKEEYIKYVHPNLEGAYSGMLAEIKRNDTMPTAFVAANDTIAIGAMKALKEYDYDIPAQISVVGFDDIPFGRVLDKSLTTMHVDKDQLGKLAVKALHYKITDCSKGCIKMVTRTRLIERESTCAPGDRIES